MPISRTVLWIAEIIAVWAILFMIQLPLRKRERPVLRIAVFFIKVLLIPATALLFVAVDWKFSYRCGDVLTAVYVALLGDTAASAAEYVIRRIKNRKDKTAGRRPALRKLNFALSFLFCAAFFVFGTVNAAHVVKKEHSWQTDGLVREHVFAFLADIHAGNAQPLKTLEDVCRRINDESPEFVILGGDITDELTSRDDMLSAYDILSKIEAPVYFVYGNHDRQPAGDHVGGRTYSDEELESAIKDAGIVILKDEYVRIADDLVLFGREDLSRKDDRKPWQQLSDLFGGDSALIVADHQPYDGEQLSMEVSALQLSGHTHAGQLWPLQLVYRLAGFPAYGEFEKSGTRLFVTAGESGWMMPLRTEARCEWDLITLRP